jgi:hypothetical protein
MDNTQWIDWEEVIAEQESVALRDSLRREKLKKAEERFDLRMVYMAILGVILFLILVCYTDNINNWVQLLCSIVFFGLAAFVFGRIWVLYKREEEEAHTEYYLDQ